MGEYVRRGHPAPELSPVQSTARPTGELPPWASASAEPCSSTRAADAAPAALGATSNVSIGNGAQFLAFNNTTNSYSYNQNFSINGMGWGEGGLNLGALRVSTMNATFTGGITLTGDSGLLLQSPAGGVMTVSGNISGAQSLSIYNDRGTAAAITLSGANSYSGATTLSRGLLSVNTLGGWRRDQLGSATRRMRLPIWCSPPRRLPRSATPA